MSGPTTAQPSPVPNGQSGQSPTAAHTSAPPGRVEVICPAGFNATSMKGVDPKKALYARVTYQPA